MKIDNTRTIINNLLDKSGDKAFLIVAGDRDEIVKAIGSDAMATHIALTNKLLYDLVDKNEVLQRKLIDRIIERAAL